MFHVDEEEGSLNRVFVELEGEKTEQAAAEGIRVMTYDGTHNTNILGAQLGLIRGKQLMETSLLLLLIYCFTNAMRITYGLTIVF